MLRTSVQEVLPVIRSFQLDMSGGSVLDLSLRGMPLYLGKFQGRQDTVLTYPNGFPRMFLFVVQGAFEVQSRLLESRDGMMIWQTDQLDMEALSHDAIILALGLEHA
jgi:hypothetical protein